MKQIDYKKNIEFTNFNKYIESEKYNSIYNELHLDSQVIYLLQPVDRIKIIESTIQYFIQFEDYEKCNFLLKFKN